MGSEDTRRAYRQIAEESFEGNPHVRLRLIKNEASKMLTLLVESVARTSMAKQYSIQEARRVRSGWYDARWARLVRWLSKRRAGRWLLPGSLRDVAWAHVWQLESRLLPLPKETEDRIRIQLSELYRREMEPERILVGWKDNLEVRRMGLEYPRIAGLPVERCPWLEDDAVVVIGKVVVVRSV